MVARLPKAENYRHLPFGRCHFYAYFQSKKGGGSMMPFGLKEDYESITSLLSLLEQQPTIGQALRELQKNNAQLYQHSICVALLSRWIGKMIGLSEREIYELTQAGLLHDIGITRLPTPLWSNMETYIEEEKAEVKKHTFYGFHMVLEASVISHRVALVALQHHERADGSGYPYGLKGYELYPHSKIVTVADTFHKKASKHNVTDLQTLYPILFDLWHNEQSVLDQEVTCPFIYAMMKLFLHHPVMLSNGMQGYIRHVTQNNPMYPIVQVNGMLVKLDSDTSLHIERIM